VGFPKKASNRLRAAKSAGKLSADFTNRRESGRQTAELYEFPRRLPSGEVACDANGERSCKTVRTADFPSGGPRAKRPSRLEWIWRKASPFGSPRVRQRAHSVRKKEK